MFQKQGGLHNAWPPLIGGDLQNNTKITPKLHPLIGGDLQNNGKITPQPPLILIPPLIQTLGGEKSAKNVQIWESKNATFPP